MSNTTIPAIGNTWTPKTVPADAYAELGSASQAPGLGSARMLGSFLTGPFMNVKGWGAVGDGVANDTAAIQDAIDTASAAGGGVIFFPVGTFKVTTITVPAKVQLRGCGRGSLITSAANAYAVDCGGAAGALYYNIAVCDLAIKGTADNTKGVRLRGVAGGLLSNLYLEGAFSATAANVGVCIDGGNASCFFNLIENVLCNHWKQNFLITKTGSSNSTVQTFVGCSAFGDVTSFPGLASSGITVEADQGQGTTWHGGNFEQCAVGIDLRQSSGQIGFHGVRFEDNTNDVTFGLFTKNNLILNARNLDTVVDNSGTGFGFHTILNNSTSAGLPRLNELFATRFNGIDGGTTPPVRIRQYPSATVNPLEISDSNSANVYFSVGPNGDINKINAYTLTITNGNDSPEGNITAPVGSLWMRRNGGTSTMWYQKISGAGNTGWAPLLNA